MIEAGCPLIWKPFHPNPHYTTRGEGVIPFAPLEPPWPMAWGYWCGCDGETQHHQSCESFVETSVKKRVPHNERSCQCVKPCFAFTLLQSLPIISMYESFVERVWEAIHRNAIQCFRPCFALACQSMHHDQLYHDWEQMWTSTQI